jgi:hypothetical protein
MSEEIDVGSQGLQQRTIPGDLQGALAVCRPAVQQSVLGKHKREQCYSGMHPPTRRAYDSDGPAGCPEEILKLLNIPVCFLHIYFISNFSIFTLFLLILL